MYLGPAEEQIRYLELLKKENPKSCLEKEASKIDPDLLKSWEEDKRSWKGESEVDDADSEVSKAESLAYYSETKSHCSLVDPLRKEKEDFSEESSTHDLIHLGGKKKLISTSESSDVSMPPDLSTLKVLADLPSKRGLLYRVQSNELIKESSVNIKLRRDAWSMKAMI